MLGNEDAATPELRSLVNGESHLIQARKSTPTFDYDNVYNQRTVYPTHLRMVSGNRSYLDRNFESTGLLPIQFTTISREDSLERENELLKRRIEDLEKENRILRQLLSKERANR